MTKLVMTLVSSNLVFPMSAGCEADAASTALYWVHGAAHESAQPDDATATAYAAASGREDGLCQIQSAYGRCLQTLGSCASTRGPL